MDFLVWLVAGKRQFHPTAPQKKGIFFDYSTDRQFQALILN
jgi:hypothetical protein